MGSARPSACLAPNWSTTSRPIRLCCQDSWKLRTHSVMSWAGAGIRKVLPNYDELASAEPAGSSWDVFGRDDQLGTINLLTTDRVVEAARLIRTGQRFNL